LSFREELKTVVLVVIGFNGLTCKDASVKWCCEDCDDDDDDDDDAEEDRTDLISFSKKDTRLSPWS
jgi:hypothetical protein